jgi:hypothetical protein
MGWGWDHGRIPLASHAYLARISVLSHANLARISTDARPINGRSRRSISPPPDAKGPARRESGRASLLSFKAIAPQPEPKMNVIYL